MTGDKITAILSLQASKKIPQVKRIPKTISHPITFLCFLQKDRIVFISLCSLASTVGNIHQLCITLKLLPYSNYNLHYILSGIKCNKRNAKE